MDSELIKLVSERTGLPPDTAKTAVDTVIGYLKEKLPAPVASQIDSALSSGGSQGGGPLGGLGDLFRGR